MMPMMRQHASFVWWHFTGLQGHHRLFDNFRLIGLAGTRKHQVPDKKGNMLFLHEFVAGHVLAHVVNEAARGQFGLFHSTVRLVKDLIVLFIREIGSSEGHHGDFFLAQVLRHFLHIFIPLVGQRSNGVGSVITSLKVLDFGFDIFQHLHELDMIFDHVTSRVVLGKLNSLGQFGCHEIFGLMMLVDKFHVHGQDALEGGNFPILNGSRSIALRRRPQGRLGGGQFATQRIVGLDPAIVRQFVMISVFLIWQEGRIGLVFGQVGVQGQCRCRWTSSSSSSSHFDVDGWVLMLLF
mmetsp:Transcript_23329/g.53538  ORF Transcript_23329/g.53538 Transcript_23329/m.53538 type:complete len:294 (-) Transcript_23329:2-883(-)